MSNVKAPTAQQLEAAFKGGLLGFSTMSEYREESKEMTKHGFLVEGLLPRGGSSALGAKAKTGKSSMSRQLSVCVAKGQGTFLNRSVQQGTVLYYALEGGGEIIDHFNSLGLTDADPLRMFHHVMPKGLGMLHLKMCLERISDVVLVVVDTLYKFVNVTDANAYTENVNALEELTQIVRAHPNHPHLLTLHHLKKRDVEDSIDGFLGSSAIGAGVDTCLYLRKQKGGNGVRTMSCDMRWDTTGHSAFPETQLEWNADNRTCTFGRCVEEVETEQACLANERVEQAVIDYITAHPLCSKDEVESAVSGYAPRKRSVIQQLLDSGVLIGARTNERGRPYRLRMMDIVYEDAKQLVTTGQPGYIAA